MIYQYLKVKLKMVNYLMKFGHCKIVGMLLNLIVLVIRTNRSRERTSVSLQIFIFNAKHQHLKI